MSVSLLMSISLLMSMSLLMCLRPFSSPLACLCFFCLSLYLVNLSLPLLISLSFPLFVLPALFLCSMTMTMTARPVGSLCTHGPDLPRVPECVGAHSLSGEHVLIMQETFVWDIPVQASCHLGSCGPVSVLEGRMCLEWCAVLCVFVRVLSMLSSMTGSRKNDICNRT